MKNIKEFCKEHKNKIVFVGCMIGSAVIGALVYRQLNPVEETVDPYEDKYVLSWIPTEKFINLERAKEILDLNANNNETLAIFKEGVNADDYTCVLFSDNVITDTSEKA
jgi:hypothetical protein